MTDETVIASADWLTNVGNAAAGWVALTPREGPEADAPETPAKPIALARDDSPTSQPEDETVEEAQIGTPLAFGVAAAMSFRYHQPFVRWLKRTRTGADPKRSAPQAKAARGPHTRF